MADFAYDAAQFLTKGNEKQLLKDLYKLSPGVVGKIYAPAALPVAVGERITINKVFPPRKKKTGETEYEKLIKKYQR
ncbi:MAG: hypothetical protein V1709_11655 [Planctomycetota bacterium]